MAGPTLSLGWRARFVSAQASGRWTESALAELFRQRRITALSGSYDDDGGMPLEAVNPQMVILALAYGKRLPAVVAARIGIRSPQTKGTAELDQ